MFRLAWATDTHLNMLRIPEAPKLFGEYLSAETSCDALVITGDISEGSRVFPHLKQMREGLNKPLHYVMGNHDYYYSSFEEVHALMSPEPGWLTVSRPVSLTPDVALVGNEGWYDGRVGNPYGSFHMLDWDLIQDLVGLSLTKSALLEKVFRTASQRAFQAEAVVQAALKTHKTIIFATHFPPFPGASWYETGYSSPITLPWYTSVTMGEMLTRQAVAYPDHKILVLCGHTHSFGVYDHLPNLKVITGRAVYGAPDLAGILDIDGSAISLRVNNRDWLDLGAF
jgi:predicted phosphohydrolase